MVLLAMVFVAMMLSITAAISIARALVVKSECECFGHVWTKAILSEYDLNLLNDYNLMAYWGNEAEIQKKINVYLDYSAGNKLDASIGNVASELKGYELGDVENFRKAVKASFAYSAIDSVINGKERQVRKDDDEDDYGSRSVVNPVVIDTLPSNGVHGKPNTGSLEDNRDADTAVKNLLDSAKNFGAEMAFINKYLGSHVTRGSGQNGFMKNEWEYIISGDNSDEENYEYCRNCIILIREAANVAYLLKDPEKMEVVSSISQCLTPGPAGLLTTSVIVGIWASVETKMDMDTLLDNGRVPFVKTAETWRTDVDSLLSSDDFDDKLDDDSRDALGDEEDDIKEMNGASGENGSWSDGQTYDEYLMVLMMLVNKDVRTLRLMDIIQINMKYWHYKDFNMMEYFTGVRYSINANGKNYDFEECYK